MDQINFSNQNSRFHHSATSTIVDRIIFPQIVNDTR